MISGVKNLSAYEGDTISYRSGVTAYDETDGTVIVYVNSKNVNTSVAGTYTVTYTAYDTSGNAATASAKVTIKPVTQSTLDSLADEILSVIITGSMTEREKAKAIYDWCCENLKYSTVTSYTLDRVLKPRIQATSCATATATLITRSRALCSPARELRI